MDLFGLVLAGVAVAAGALVVWAAIKVTTEPRCTVLLAHAQPAPHPRRDLHREDHPQPRRTPGARRLSLPRLARPEEYVMDQEKTVRFHEADPDDLPDDAPAGGDLAVRYVLNQDNYCARHQQSRAICRTGRVDGACIVGLWPDEARLSDPGGTVSP